MSEPIKKPDASKPAVPEDCPTCKLIRERDNGFGPTHRGSKNCESGSLASGGEHAHCSCDTCF